MSVRPLENGHVASTYRQLRDLRIRHESKCVGDLGVQPIKHVDVALVGRSAAEDVLVQERLLD